MNSSIISIGWKLNILRNISSFDKNLIEKINKLASIRNAFAHLKTNDTVGITIKFDKNMNAGKVEITSFKSELEVMNSSGEIKIKNMKALILEYQNLYKEIETYLSIFTKVTEDRIVT